MRIRDVVRSTAFRLAVGFALAVTAATSVVFALVYVQISTSDVERLRGILVSEAARGVTESDAELHEALDLRLTRDLRRLDYVALFDRHGRLIYGNIERMPPLPVDGEAHFLAAVRPPGVVGRTEPALFVARARADGGVLLLGRSLLEVYAIRGTVLRSLATGLAPTILLALAIGAFFSSRASRRLVQIHESIARIMKGDLRARLPVGAGDDDIDKVARAINLMLDEIVRLLDQLKNVGDNIAHDLRTPLAVMRAKLERGLAPGASHEDVGAAAADALDQLDRAMLTVAALLRISAVERELRSSAFREIDLAAICAELFDFYEPLARSKAIEMSLEAPAPAVMLGDGDLMREALSNLIDNAIKFTPSGGSVRLEAVLDAGRPLVRVSDSGRGVPPDEREKIFQRLYRGEEGAPIPGHGLGLSIAATIAGLHGLTIAVTDNHPGARFEIAASP